MQFLNLYTPARPPGGPPSMEHMAAMGALMERMFASGVLKGTGGIMNRSTGFKAVMEDGKMTTADGDIAGCSLMPAAGWAWLEVRDRQHLAEVMREFMIVAGDGKCEAIEVMTGPPPEA